MFNDPTCCCCLIAQSCPTPLRPYIYIYIYSSPGSFVHEISQTRIREWVAIFFSRGYSQSRDWNCISCIGRWVLYHWATREAQLYLQSGIRGELLAGYFYIHSQLPLPFTFHHQFSSVTQLWPTLCNSMGCSTPGFPVHHQLPELAQTHVHWVHLSQYRWKNYNTCFFWSPLKLTIANWTQL